MGIRPIMLVALCLVGLAGLSCAHDSAVELEPLEPPLEIDARVDRALATIGDVITYTVTVEHDSELLNPEQPFDLSLQQVPGVGDERGDLGGLEIIDSGVEPPRQVEGRTVREQWLRLRAGLPGSYILPSIQISVRGEGVGQEQVQTVETAEIFVEVQSVLPADGSVEDIKGLKPLEPIPSRWLPWVVAAAIAGVVLVILAWWLWWRRRHRKAAPGPPPDRLALTALAELEADALDGRDAVRRFYFAVSAIVRTYVEGRFALNATDLTTEEILAQLPEMDELGGEQAHSLGQFLESTDEVKFAARDPLTSEPPAIKSDAVAFVEATRPLELEADAVR